MVSLVSPGFWMRRYEKIGHALLFDLSGGVSLRKFGMRTFMLGVCRSTSNNDDERKTQLIECARINDHEAVKGLQYLKKGVPVRYSDRLLGVSFHSAKLF
jgi:hypothetical protein